MSTTAGAPSITLPDGTVATLGDFADCRVTFHAREIPGGIEVSCHGLRSIFVGVGGAKIREGVPVASGALFAEIRRRFERAIERSVQRMFLEAQ